MASYRNINSDAGKFSRIDTDRIAKPKLSDDAMKTTIRAMQKGLSQKDMSIG